MGIVYRWPTIVTDKDAAVHPPPTPPIASSLAHDSSIYLQPSTPLLHDSSTNMALICLAGTSHLTTGSVTQCGTRRINTLIRSRSVLESET